MNKDISLSLADHSHSATLNAKMKIGLALGVTALLALLVGWFNNLSNPWLLTAFLASLVAGSLLYTYGLYAGKPAGIKNDGVWFKSISSRGTWAWITGIVLTAFYVLLYWWPAYLGFNAKGNTGLVGFFDPVSYALRKLPASQWFMYGLLYTLAILLLGIKFIVKHRNSRYQIIRTLSVMFFQLAFAFLIPNILERLNPASADKAYFGKDIKNMWPLNYDFFKEWHLEHMLNGGNVGWFMLISGIVMILIVSPILTYFYGKRWYCSWVCGCGGLAETAGDSFRQLSSKSTKAWKIERYLIYSVLVFAVVMTALTIYTYFTHKSQILFLDAYQLQKWYGFFIGAVFSGVVGVGLYPLLGTRVWCRFGCPMAAILGIQQKFFSRFRITTNGAQCISCGNCSTYCEMGIDVRAYAQRGQDIVRASCVGCGVCSSVCPRGVLKLENGPQKTRKLDGPVQYVDGKFEID
jgi:polyferredoxin